MSTHDFIGLTEVAELLGLSRQAVFRDAKKGRIPYVARIGVRGQFVFSREVIYQIKDDMERTNDDD
jgi:predicted DNA-binding transcriptional regulator AlpA